MLDRCLLKANIKKETFNPNALRIVNEMRNKARSQEKFTL